jgi:hypothetical protein
MQSQENIASAERNGVYEAMPHALFILYLPSLCYTACCIRDPHDPRTVVLHRWDQASRIVCPSTAFGWAKVNRLCSTAPNSYLRAALEPIVVRSSYVVMNTLRQALLSVLSESCSRSCSTMRIADLCGDMQGSSTHQRASIKEQDKACGCGADI